jgi:hypothetical protein
MAARGWEPVSVVTLDYAKRSCFAPVLLRPPALPQSSTQGRKGAKARRAWLGLGGPEERARHRQVQASHLTIDYAKRPLRPPAPLLPCSPAPRTGTTQRRSPAAPPASHTAAGWLPMPPAKPSRPCRLPQAIRRALPPGKPNRIGRASRCGLGLVAGCGVVRGQNGTQVNADCSAGFRCQEADSARISAASAPISVLFLVCGRPVSQPPLLDTQIGLCYPPNVRIVGRLRDTKSPSPLKGLRCGRSRARRGDQTALT